MPLEMKPLAPFNITILDPNDYIKRRGCLPVTSFSIFEASSTRFHPDGLFSEVIFGQVGSKERLVRRGYFDLRTKIITPHLYKQILTLKSFYKQILAGTAYARLGADGDLELCEPTDDGARTGFTFFISVLPKLKFATSPSPKRQDKINLIYKYRDQLLIDKFIILPAGVRDVRIDKDGRANPEEINKLYTNMLSFINALPIDGNADPVYDPIRLQLQNKALEVYEYIASLMEGKHGFAQGKLVARSVVYGCRNVITAAPMSKVSGPSSPQALQINEIMIPLFQAMKSATPVMVHNLRMVYFDQIFSDQSLTIPAIDPETLGIVYIDITNMELQKFTTSQGINKLINNYRNPHNHFKPVTVTGTTAGSTSDTRKEFYMYLIYDDGGDELYCFRSKSDFDNYMQTQTLPHPTQDVLDVLNSLPLDKNDVVVVGSTAAELLLGPAPDESVLQGYEFVVRDDKIKTSILKQLDLTNPTLRDQCIIRAATASEMVWFDTDSAKAGLFDIDGFKVLNFATLLNQYVNNPTPRAADKDIIKRLKQHTYDPKFIRPITWTEMFYTAAFVGLDGRHTTATRHPMLLLQNITLNKIKLMSTNTARIVHFKTLGGETVPVTYPQYPVLTSTVKGSMSVHPAHLEKYDGRMVAIVGCNTLYL